MKRAVFVPFEGRNGRQLAATRYTKPPLATFGVETSSATRSTIRYHAAIRRKKAETPLLTGGLLVRIQPEEPYRV
jgi:hypothetical protein